MNHDDLSELINHLVSGTITEEDHAKLQTRLRDDAAARTIFRERIDLEAALHTWATEDTPATTSLTEAQSGGTLQSRGFFRSSPTHLLGAVAVTAAAVAVIAIIWFASSGNNAPDQIAEDTQQDPAINDGGSDFGQLVQQQNCEWKQLPPENGRFYAGLIELTAGIAELRFDSGTNVVVESPCSLRVESSDSAQLLAGTVFVDVTEISRGFVLTTPEANIVDDGTQYAVTLDANSTEVHVFDGSVIWTALENSGDFEDRIQSGEAKRFSRSAPNRPHRIAFGKREFVRRVEQQVKDTAGTALVAYDGFENLAGRLRRGRSGFGWTDGWLPGGAGRGRLAQIVDTNDDVVFGIDRNGRRQLLLEYGCDIRRVFEFAPDFSRGDHIFVSVLISRQAALDAGDSQSLQISLEPDLPGRGRRRHQIVSFGITSDSFPFINSGRAITKTASPIATDQTYLCILRLSVGEKGTLPSLRVYQPNEQIDRTEPASWTVTGEVGSTRYPPASIRIIAGENASWLIDELKVGSTWEAVTNTSHVE